jgi:hypothetical protein
MAVAAPRLARKPMARASRNRRCHARRAVTLYRMRGFSGLPVELRHVTALKFFSAAVNEKCPRRPLPRPTGALEAGKRPKPKPRGSLLVPDCLCRDQRLKRAAHQAVSDPPLLLITPGCALGRARSVVDRMDAPVARPRTRDVYTRTISKRTRRVNIEVRAVSKYAPRMRAPD